MRRLRLVTIVAAAWVAPACGDNIMVAVDADVGDAAWVGQGGPPRSDLIVNEVSARPDQGADWIELHNRGEDPIDLCGFYLTDSLDRLDHYLLLGNGAVPTDCEPQWIEPASYLVVFADDAAESGTTHAPFKLGVADEVHLVDASGQAVDSLVYLHPASGDGLALARVPDAEGLFWLRAPSPGDVNPEDGGQP